MSRGLGKVEEAILERLKYEGKCSLSGLAFDLYHLKLCPSKNQKAIYASVSRAVGRLEKLGYVKKTREYGEGYTQSNKVFGSVFVELVKR